MPTQTQSLTTRTLPLQNVDNSHIVPKYVSADTENLLSLSIYNEQKLAITKPWQPSKQVPAANYVSLSVCASQRELSWILSKTVSY